jgi:hypothetical protein
VGPVDQHVAPARSRDWPARIITIMTRRSARPIGNETSVTAVDTAVAASPPGAAVYRLALPVPGRSVLPNAPVRVSAFNWVPPLAELCGKLGDEVDQAAW